MKRSRYIYLTVLTAFAVSSCDFLEVEPQIIEGGNQYSTETDVLGGLAGVYGVINNAEFYGNNYSIPISGTDDLTYYNRTTNTDYMPIYRYDASTATIDEAWKEIYQGIKNANAFMDAMAVSELECAPAYSNEARFLRAYYHFVLAQAWGDVPLRDKSVLSALETQIAATPQADVLKWVVSEMEGCIDAGLSEDLTIAPSRVIKTTAQGILARVYLFMAGETVKCTDAEKKEFYKNAMDCAWDVMESGKHRLHKNYSEVFTNMMSDKYDREYYESMWEADFKGDRSSSDNWTNGRIGDINGLQSSGGSNFSKFKCNYSYGQYNGSLKLWDLYWAEDRTDDELRMNTVTDSRQAWNMPPYNYAGSKEKPYDWVAGDSRTKSEASLDKAPYSYNPKGTEQGDGVTSLSNQIAAQGIRNSGKFRREVEYEGVMTAKQLYTCINFPILRYADVLLMYAEAYNEYNGAPTEDVFGYVLEVRERAGVKTKDYAGNYDTYETFRDLVRNERGRELCFEALRKYDLIRWGIFVESMHGYVQDASDSRWTVHALSKLAASTGSSVQEKHIVLPIPSVELGVNKLLHQNPLW